MTDQNRQDGTAKASKKRRTQDAPEIAEEERGRKGRFLDILQTVFYLALVLLATWFIITYVGQRTTVSGSSMEPTLSDGDQLILDKITYRFRDPERFDIIVFPYRYGQDTYYVKRIIALPGETVQIDAMGNIWINGEILEEEYGLETIRYAGTASEPITLGEDEYFVLGDNRNNSADSRFENVGLVSRSDIIGRAWCRLWPLSGFGLLKDS